MSDISLDDLMLHGQKIQAECDKLRAENKALKKIDLKHRKLLKDHIDINELLMVENKALKAENHRVNVRLSNYQGDLADRIISLEDENEALKESRDELLEIAKLTVNAITPTDDWKRIAIQKAEALRRKKHE